MPPKRAAKDKAVKMLEHLAREESAEMKEEEKEAAPPAFSAPSIPSEPVMVSHEKASTPFDPHCASNQAITSSEPSSTSYAHASSPYQRAPGSYGPAISRTVHHPATQRQQQNNAEPPPAQLHELRAIEGDGYGDVPAGKYAFAWTQEYPYLSVPTSYPDQLRAQEMPLQPSILPHPGGFALGNAFGDVKTKVFAPGGSFGQPGFVVGGSGGPSHSWTSHKKRKSLYNSVNPTDLSVEENELMDELESMIARRREILVRLDEIGHLKQGLSENGRAEKEEGV
jgi:hypothetical protein